MSESWLHENSSNAAITVPGFSIFRNDRKHGKGGGALCYVKESISCNELLFTNCDLECLGSISGNVFHPNCIIPAPLSNC